MKRRSTRIVAPDADTALSDSRERLVVEAAWTSVNANECARTGRCWYQRILQIPAAYGDKARQTGFTLIELMITVVVIAILAAVALPSYQSYIRQARRVEAQASLIDLQQDLEKWRVNNTSYSGCPSNTCSAPPSDYYDFSVTSADQTSYSIQAAAKGTQTADSDCTPLTLDQDSAKGPDGCWKQ
jgi:type IV pilus assembly protein PilE